MADLVLSFTSSELQNLRASQYVSAAGLVVLLWDHFLTFHDEVELVWRARLSFPKVLFLFNRYVVPVSLIVLTYEFQFCQTWFGVGIVVGMVSIGTSNFLILLRLWVLWDRKTRLVLVTLALFIVTQITMMCSGANVAQIVFEFMIFIMTWWNALDKPHPQHAKMAKVMYRDGSIYFFFEPADLRQALFGLRLVNLILSIISPLSLMFLGVFFIWSACNVTLTRLIMNLRRVAAEAEENGFEETYIDSQRGWPLLPKQGPGSCMSGNYELQGKGPDIGTCNSPSVASTIM
ncbi:hypothetical protein DEU56DRAFT_753105 [Suillus clintonianus]|uniref:uncharacterized protein n=1 Tax=Suillus clintonianus TaxID=1904413 RepID=UPI001B869E23|nr:uncharacterized protein DEU56DRAFT_753105 [Suillus clintonianus]KAG2148871.1 hypothetical protein DEU56DRAFT_753105 [Suillus clintonianus]